jgi:hypothetical protein
LLKGNDRLIPYLNLRIHSTGDEPYLHIENYRFVAADRDFEPILTLFG